MARHEHEYLYLKKQSKYYYIICTIKTIYSENVSYIRNSVR